MNQTLQNVINAVVPLQQIAQICSTVYPPFAVVGFFLLCIGYMMAIARDDTGQRALGRFIILAGAIGAAPWFLTIIQEIVNGLVNAIGELAGGSWEVTPNATNTQLTMDWTGPYKQIGTFVTGNFPSINGTQWWEFGKWFTYAVQEILIVTAALVGGVTITVMQAMLIVKRIILLMSGPIMPLAIGGLFIPAAQGSAQNILKGIVGVIAWPLGWGIASIGWMAGLKLLQAPTWGSNPGSIMVVLIPFLFTCIWMAVSVVGAPAIISASVTHGTNAVAGMVARTAAIGAAQAGAAIGGGASVVGAGMGARTGPEGVHAGAQIGRNVGSALASSFTGASASLQQFYGSRHSGSADASRAYADAAIAAIKSKAKG